MVARFSRTCTCTCILKNVFLKLYKWYQMAQPISNFIVLTTFFIPCRYFFEFLLAHHQQVAREIVDEYIDTMSKIYSSYFAGYIAKLMKLQVSQNLVILRVSKKKCQTNKARRNCIFKINGKQQDYIKLPFFLNFNRLQLVGRSCFVAKYVAKI